MSVNGLQSTKLLQGLFTNDIEKVTVGSVMFTHVLNVKGRVLFDSIVYSVDEHSFLIEVDKSLAGNFVKLLKMYNIRSKAAISEEEVEVYASFSSGSPTDDIDSEDGSYPDPRLSLLGRRYLGKPPKDAVIVSEDEYHQLRVSLGVSEGSRDIAHGKDFPFEHNLDYLNGVSFTKGCYVGQELTARTHHVGETRKRVVPVRLSGPLPQDILPAKLTTGKRGAGKLLSVYGDMGLAVIRFPYLDMDLDVGGGSGVTVIGSKPEWWPEDDR